MSLRGSAHGSHLGVRMSLFVMLTLAPSARAEALNPPVAWHVSPAGSDSADGSAATPFRTIQYAVDIAAAGDTVRLFNGTYAGVGNAPVAWSDKALSILSASGDRDACVIDCAGDDGFRFVDTNLVDAHSLTVTGLTFANADTAISVSRVGLSYDLRVWLKLTNCSAQNGNVGVASHGGWLLLNDCAFSGNMSAGIAGGYVFGLTMDNCDVRDNGIGLVFTQMNGYPAAEISNSHFVGNGGGIRYWQEGSGMTMRFSSVDSSTTSHGIRTSSDFEALNLVHCTINGNAGHGIANAQSTAVVATGGEMCGNGLSGIATVAYATALRLYGVRLAGNAEWGVGKYEAQDGVAGTSGGKPGEKSGDKSGDKSPDKDPACDIDIAGCDILGNGEGGVSLAGDFAPMNIRDCTIARNGGAGLVLGSTRAGAACSLARTTVVANQGTGVELTVGAWSFAQTLVSHNLGEAVLSSGIGASAMLACSDLFGNTGGDWTPTLLPQLGVGGNVEVDPFYCDLDAGDYFLRDDSPLAPAHSGGCDLIGRMGTACPPLPAQVAPVPGIADASAAVPTLHPNWPNPFNPRTTVAFDLPRAARARLDVYDVAGRLVRTLIDGAMPEGRHEFTWDGRDRAGRDAGSGVYVARLVSEGAVGSVRMQLVR